MKMSSAYEPGKHESNIYSLWEQGRVFKADPTSDKLRFSISMPPPNETGSLHLGHAIGTTLQDILSRRARQEGKDVLWLPGTDHAALPVNALIEKQLAEQGTNKHQIGRDEFLRRTREFVGTSRNTMNAQLKALGASCDWSRARYTLDDTLNRCVNEVFVKMFNDGLIYRGNRIVNWDPNLETTVSDDEVEHQTETGAFYTLQYGPFQIGTARPETKFGDKYVVMHPEDKRYANYKHGDKFEAEWINGPVTATVIKDAAVDPDFGTGVMTITPWHDHTDFEIAERHGLEKDQIIGFDGRLLAIAGEFAGQTIAEARPKIVEKLKAKDLLVGVDEKYAHNLALNSRGKGVIEPQIKLQWFVDVNRPIVDWKGQKRSLKEVMRAVIDDGDVQIIPPRFEKVYFHWIDNLRDWCISRQIWWGHQVPVWYKGDEQYAGVEPPKDEGWQQDPDTLDTWFSSALWTWSTLIDPELAQDFSLSLDDLLQGSLDYKTYHPTSVLETSWDILFFWVARMILATTYATGNIPFETVYLHGLILTAGGKKMSKSNPEGSIDPSEVIAEYGADALRFALVSGTSAGSAQQLSKDKIVANRNFCNKIWNVARYIQEAVGEAPGSTARPESLADHYILNKLSILASDLDKQLGKYRFADAYEALYHFIWDDLADWYIEASKAEPNREVLAHVLRSTLVLSHPFAPFLTEAIWQELGWDKGLLATQQLPKIIVGDEAKAAEFEDLQNLIIQARNLISIMGLTKPGLFYADSSLVNENSGLIKKLARLGEIAHAGAGQKGLRLFSGDLEAWLDVPAAKAQAHLSKLRSSLQGHEAAAERLEARLASPGYQDKAPQDVVAQTHDQLAQEKQLAAALAAEISSFEKALG